MSASKLTKVEDRILLAWNRYYGANGTLGDYEAELLRIANDLATEWSTDARALANMRESAELGRRMSEARARRRGRP